LALIGWKNLQKPRLTIRARLRAKAHRRKAQAARVLVRQK
jgi:hypothetical protein